MVYNEKFVAVIKAGGKILREKGDVIYIPFGSEYSILLKNLNTVKAVVKVSIDGDDTLDGNELIIGANSTAQLEGFMKGRKVTNKFKFIEKTDQIAEYRGNKVSDGFVRISFRFEAEIKVPELLVDPMWPNNDYNPSWHINNYGSRSIPTYSASPDRTYSTMPSSKQRSAGIEPPIDTHYTRKTKSFRKTKIKGPATLGCMSLSSSDIPCSADEAGITVKGSESYQQFRVGTVGALEAQEHVIVLSLKGRLQNKPVKKAITIKTKVTCTTCGKRNKSSSKFCTNCGTALF